MHHCVAFGPVASKSKGSHFKIKDSLSTSLECAAIISSVVQEMGRLKSILYKQISDLTDRLKGYLQCYTKGIRAHGQRQAPPSPLCLKAA